MKQRQHGFSQSELLITLGVIGIVAAIAIPFTLQTLNNNATVEKQLIETQNTIAHVFDDKETQEGLISRNTSPSQIIASKVTHKNTTVISRANAGSLPANVNVTLPATVIELRDGRKVYAPNQWLLKPSGQDVSTIFVTSDAKIRRFNVFRNGSRKLALKNAASGSQASSVTLVSTPTTTTATSQPAVVQNASIPLAHVIPVPQYEDLAWFAREKDRKINFRYGFPQIKNLTDFFGANQAKVGEYEHTAGFLVQFFNKKGDPVEDRIVVETFYTKVKVNWGPVSATTLSKIGWTKGLSNLSFDDAVTLGRKLAAANPNPNNPCNSARTRGRWATQHDKALCVFRDIGAPGMPSQVLYTSPSGKTYNIVSGYLEVSPIKIGLNKKAPIPTSEGGFYFDVDGFTSKHFPPLKTTGGLTQDEAWLVLDRNHDGLSKKSTFEKEQITLVDGADLFGDHLGKYRSGYEDLSETFKANLEKDADGLYISLKEVPWWEALWLSILRFFGLSNELNPSLDLMLMDRNNHVVKANSLISKIYVDYKDVSEYDASENNGILQRARLVYKDGTVSTSGDLWFRPEFLLFALDTEETNEADSAATQNN